jgi:hypothetical protein
MENAMQIFISQRVVRMSMNANISVWRKGNLGESLDGDQLEIYKNILNQYATRASSPDA